MRTIQTLIVVLIMSTISFTGYSQTTKPVDQKQTEAEASYIKAMKAMNDYQYKDAIALFDVAIALKSDMAGAYYYRAVCKCNLGLKEEACPDLKRASELGHYVEKVSIPCGCDAKDPK